MDTKLTKVDKDVTWPVMEIFGPTIQGEGPQIGQKTMFIRFGGCEYRCSWCDSLHAVLPERVAKEGRRLNIESIVSDTVQYDTMGHGQTHLRAYSPWVVLSGGNPAIHNLEPIIHRLHLNGYKIMIETQGSRHPSWLGLCDHITISPKPPSSGMAKKYDPEIIRRIIENFIETQPDISSAKGLSIKIPIFDSPDYEWALDVHKEFPGIPFYMSVGNPKTEGKADRADLLRRLKWMAEKVIEDKRASKVIVLPQLHVLLWGNKKGV